MAARQYVFREDFVMQDTPSNPPSSDEESVTQQHPQDTDTLGEDEVRVNVDKSQSSLHILYSKFIITIYFQTNSEVDPSSCPVERLECILNVSQIPAVTFI